MEVFRSLVRDVGTLAASYTAESGRSESHAMDILDVLSLMDISLSDLIEFAADENSKKESAGFVKPLPAFPAKRVSLTHSPFFSKEKDSINPAAMNIRPADSGESRDGVTVGPSASGNVVGGEPVKNEPPMIVGGAVESVSNADRCMYEHFPPYPPAVTLNPSGPDYGTVTTYESQHILPPRDSQEKAAVWRALSQVEKTRRQAEALKSRKVVELSGGRAHPYLAPPRRSRPGVKEAPHLPANVAAAGTTLNNQLTDFRERSQQIRNSHQAWANKAANPSNDGTRRMVTDEVLSSSRARVAAVLATEIHLTHHPGEAEEDSSDSGGSSD